MIYLKYMGDHIYFNDRSDILDISDRFDKYNRSDEGCHQFKILISFGHFPKCHMPHMRLPPVITMA